MNNVNVPLDCSCEYVTEGFLTTQDRVVVRHAKLCDIIPLGGVLNGTWVPNQPHAKPQHIVRYKSCSPSFLPQQEKRGDVSVMSFQLQARCADYLKCVRVVLVQVGENVTARVIGADWANPGCAGVPDYGYDFSRERRSEVEVAASATDEGYGVSRLVLLNVDAWLGHVRVAMESDDEGTRVRVTLRAPSAVDISDIGVGLHWLNDVNSYGGWLLDKAPSFVEGSDSELEVVFTPTDFKIPSGVKKLFPIVYFAPNRVYKKAWFQTEREDAIEHNFVLDIDSLKRSEQENGDKYAIKHKSAEIFISYARADIKTVKPIVDEIERVTGVKPWLDLDGVETGSKFEDDVIDAIKRCRVFVFFMSKRAFESMWTRKELDYAFQCKKKDCKKKVYPVRIEEVEPSDWFNFKYAQIDCIDYSDKLQREKFFRNLKDRSADDVHFKTPERRRDIVEREIKDAKIELGRAEEELSKKQEQIAQAEEMIKSASSEIAKLTARMNRLKENIESLNAELSAI